MKRLFSSMITLSILGMLSIGFTGCTDDDGNPIDPGDDDVVAPTQLRAYSDNGEVGLYWEPSVSETQTNFKQYQLRVVEIGRTDTMSYTAQKGPGASVTGLTNGIRYNFRIFAEDTDGKLSANFANIVWAPATRQILDDQNNEIRVYATTSASNPSGIDIYNAAGKAEVINQSGAAFATRGDLFVYASSSTSSSLEIRVAQLAVNNPGPPAFFSTIGMIQANNLNAGEATSPPNTTGYTETSISIGDGSATVGQMYFGRLVRGTDFYYFRMLVRSVNGKLVQGSGAERYLILEFSYQSTPNVQYAKRTK